jgi:SAM-dependent methyltransferase
MSNTVDVSKLNAGDHHYMAYVGPPTHYDMVGAMQFRLLCALGLRANHSLLDFGCGSLRAGRLFIPYLSPGNYFGIEPNKWLIEEAIANEVGNDLIQIKKPTFDHNSDFNAGVFSIQFDFIIAQSIFSHTSKDLVHIALRQFEKAVKPTGLIVATFIEGNDEPQGTGWVYPGCVYFRRETIARFAKDAGLFSSRIPWYHPRQTWYLLAKNRDRLPSRTMMRHLTGAILFDPEFKESWQPKGWFAALRAGIFG